MKAIGAPEFFGTTWFWWMILITGAGIGSVVTCIVRFVAEDVDKAPWPQLITAGLAAGAFIVALGSYRFTWAKSRTDLFAAMHDKLLTQEAQEARRHLSAVSNRKHIEELFKPENDDMRIRVNNTLALYETFSMYADKHLVNPSLYEEMWGANIRRRREAIMWFITHRSKTEGFETWPYLRKFLRQSGS